jgi:hypothetical protein
MGRSSDCHRLALRPRDRGAELSHRASLLFVPLIGQLSNPDWLKGLSELYQSTGFEAQRNEAERSPYQ